MLRRWFLYVGSVLLGLGIVGALLGAFVLALLYPTLPSLESLTDYHPKIPLRIVSAFEIQRCPSRHYYQKLL